MEENPLERTLKKILEKVQSSIKEAKDGLNSTKRDIFLDSYSVQCVERRYYQRPKFRLKCPIATMVTF